MNIKDIDVVKSSKLITQQIEHVTCFECCKYYVAPETAACGHTLCHLCWRRRHTCPYCAKPFERRYLKYNHPLQDLTEHIRALGEAFEKLFHVKLDEFLIDTGEVESENDPSKNVKDWLTSSQNHFSAPAQSCSQEMQHPNLLNVSCNKIQIHTSNIKTKSLQEVVHVPIPQDDWDKIEPMPDTEGIKKNKENILRPMDIENFHIDDDKEYTASNPRRSSRKRDYKHTDIDNKMNVNNPLEKQNPKDTSGEVDNKSNKSKQNWNNVKRMRKEFSKLNKRYRNKLNVSIEMCKKTQSAAKYNVLPLASSPKVYEIDENTPAYFNTEKQIVKELPNQHNNDEDKNTKSYLKSEKQTVKEVPKQQKNAEDHKDAKSNSCQVMQDVCEEEPVQKPASNQENDRDSNEINIETISSSKPEQIDAHNVMERTVRLPFYKRSALRPNSITTNTVKTINHIVDSNTTANDDIEITIKVGNTITNILIKNKNDVKVKVNTDREIQTSLASNDIFVNNKAQSAQSATQNIVINLGEKHKAGVESQSKNIMRPEEYKTVVASVKSVPGKKNTDSADTATAQFEITESVEKELSKVMECTDVDESLKSKSTTTTGKEPSQNKITDKPVTNPKDHEYLNELDLFDSESVKESDIKLIKHTERAPSEILLCTVKTKQNTKKKPEKRNREITKDDDILPRSKKTKSAKSVIVPKNYALDANDIKQNRPETESMNFDAVMGTVFANIDADLEEIRQSQNINKNNVLNDHNRQIERTHNDNNKDTQDEAISGTKEINNSVQIIECHNQKDSENVFSACMEKENEDEKVPIKVPVLNIEDFLTPVMSCNIELTGLQANNDVEIMNDDSDESIVEETPQKTTSFSKTKQKINGATKEDNQSQVIELSEQRVLSNKKSSESPNRKSIINLTDTSIELKSSYNATANEPLERKTMETPLTINKFVDHIQHNSTPNARKTLTFDSENIVDLDPEKTLCPTNDVAKTTLEKEIMRKAFEKTPTSAARCKKYKIAGSCLTAYEVSKVKQLCARHKWSYTDKYAKDLTHLVVAVDDDKKSQRSVKFMCALASSIWIVSYEWVEKCLQSKNIIDEEYFEALDSTGEPGPRRSRLANKKLFQGITFFCMEPFSVLDVHTLKGMLEAAGGRCVNEVKEVKVNDDNLAPSLLLAEPENTQEDRFIYLAMELNIVPVNYEWVLNCLGSYSLNSIQELLLCPMALLPKATEKWPQELLARNEE